VFSHAEICACGAAKVKTPTLRKPRRVGHPEKLTSGKANHGDPANVETAVCPVVLADCCEVIQAFPTVKRKEEASLPLLFSLAQSIRKFLGEHIQKIIPTFFVPSSSFSIGDTGVHEGHQSFISLFPKSHGYRRLFSQGVG
jgi:hypothetical protein